LGGWVFEILGLVLELVWNGPHLIINNLIKKMELKLGWAWVGRGWSVGWAWVGLGRGLGGGWSWVELYKNNPIKK
jgi:hypothetical protein